MTGGMQGSVRQRSAGSWELRVFAGVDPDSGRRRYRSSTVRGSRDVAERELAALVAEVARQRRPERSVGELLECWFEVASVSWSPSTVRHTRSVLDCHLLPRFADVAISTVTTDVADAFFVGLVNGTIAGRALSPGTVKRVQVVLRSAFAQALRWEWVWDNPIERTHHIEVTKPDIAPPSSTELKALLDSVRVGDPALYCFVVLAAVTGARRAQLLGLRWRNIDFDRCRVAFCAGWVEGPRGPVLCSTKSKRRHVVDLDRGTIGVLSAHATRAASGHVARVDDGFVFSDDADGSTAWKPNRVTKSFVRARRRAGLREFELRQLRHFMATELLSDGVPLPVVSRRLDHRRGSTTLDYYAYAIPGGDAAASETLWKKLA